MRHYADNPQVTYDLVTLGALGNSQYFWWKEVDAEDVTRGPEGVKNWALRIKAADFATDDEDAEVTVEIDHKKTVKALDDILAGRVQAGKATLQCAELLLADPEGGVLAWDDWTTDELIQIVSFGKVVF